MNAYTAPNLLLFTPSGKRETGAGPCEGVVRGWAAIREADVLDVEFPNPAGVLAKFDSKLAEKTLKFLRTDQGRTPRAAGSPYDGARIYVSLNSLRN